MTLEELKAALEAAQAAQAAQAQKLDDFKAQYDSKIAEYESKLTDTQTKLAESQSKLAEGEQNKEQTQLSTAEAIAALQGQATEWENKFNALSAQREEDMAFGRAGIVEPRKREALKHAHKTSGTETEFFAWLSDENGAAKDPFASPFLPGKANTTTTTTTFNQPLNGGTPPQEGQLPDTSKMTAEQAIEFLAKYGIKF